MLQDRFLRKVIVVALLSAPTISALIITPLYILRPDSFHQFGVSVFFGTLLILVLWLFNILLYQFIKLTQHPERRTAWWLSSYFVSTGITFLFGHLFLHNIRTKDATFGWAFHFHLILFFAVNTLLLILMDLLGTRDRKQALEREVSRLQLKHAEAVQQQLQLQAQPHFVYNSLSTLKALIHSDRALAQEYLLLLADFLRRTESVCDKQLTPLSKELDLCRDYMTMQRIRFAEALQFSVFVPERVIATASLPVLALQQLIENAIKHNQFTREQPLYIEISYEDGWLVVQNNLCKKANSTSGGTGLANLKERYRLLAGETLKIISTPAHFSVHLKTL